MKTLGLFLFVNAIITSYSFGQKVVLHNAYPYYNEGHTVETEYGKINLRIHVNYWLYDETIFEIEREFSSIEQMNHYLKKHYCDPEILSGFKVRVYKLGVIEGANPNRVTDVRAKYSVNNSLKKIRIDC